METKDKFDKIDEIMEKLQIKQDKVEAKQLKNVNVQRATMELWMHAGGC